MLVLILEHVRRPGFDINNPANVSQPPIYDDDTPTNYNESTPPISSLDDSSLNDKIRFNHQALDLILEHVRQPGFEINNPVNVSKPPISNNDTPTNNIPVFSPPPSSNLKHPQYHPCDDCPNGLESNDDINTNDITTIDNGSNDFQPPIEDNPPKDIFPSVPSPPLSFDLKHPYYPCDCSNGWESDDDIINNDTTTTDIASNNSKPSISFDDNSDSRGVHNKFRLFFW